MATVPIIVLLYNGPLLCFNVPIKGLIANPLPLLLLLLLLIMTMTMMPMMTSQEQKMSEMIHVKVRLAQGSDTYVIHDVNADDEGRYFCRATNAFGVKEASVDVRMLGEN